MGGTIGYFHAWYLWWHGCKLDNYAMWGISFVGWSRLGKLLEFFGGFTVVLDLVGPNRLRELGHRFQLLSRLLTKLKRGIDKLARTVAWSTLLTDDRPGLVNLIQIGLLCLAWSSFSIFHKGSLATAADYSDVLVIALLVTLSGVFRFFLVPFSNFLSKLFDRKEPAHPLRWVAFILFVVGFSFDLLGG